MVEVRDSVGNSVRINVKYPRLPPKCLNCDRFGHLINRWMRPLQKGQKFKAQKRTGGLAVVKTTSELSPKEALIAKAQVLTVEIAEIPPEINLGQSSRSKRRARSRSARRARSRSRARGMSSPPEMVGVGELVKPINSALEKISEKSSASSPAMSNPQVMEGSDLPQSLNNDEKNLDSDSGGREGVDEVQEKESVWLTKHSKAYKRALGKSAMGSLSCNVLSYQGTYTSISGIPLE